MKWPICIMLALFLGALPSGRAAHCSSNTPVLRNGWYLWPPYQFENMVNDSLVLTGLDVQLVRAIFKEAGFAVSYEPRSWAQHHQDLKTGALDIAAGATYTEQRSEYAYFSDPYRTETNVLYLRSKDVERYSFASVSDMLAQMRAAGFRLGAVGGFAYASQEVRAFIADPANARTIVICENATENFRNLLSGVIDGFIVDRVEGAHLAFRQPRVSVYPLAIGSVPIHVMFSRKTCTPQMVEAFNRGLREIKASGRYREVVKFFLLPVMMSISTGSSWFFALELAGTVAFAISGILLARREQYNLVGALVLAALPAVGGGLMRDIIVVRRPAGIVRTPEYLLIVVGVVVAGYLLFRLWNLLKQKYLFSWYSDDTAQRIAENTIQIVDAIGMSAFTVIGAGVAIETACEPLWLWGPFLAALTAAGGGILSDIVRGDVRSPVLKTGIYAEIPLLCGLLFSLFINWQTERLDLGEMQFGVLITLLGAFICRMIVVFLPVSNPFIYARYEIPNKKGGSPDA